MSSAAGSSDYVFDDANRLRAVVSKNAAGANQSKTEFVYDGRSMLRVSKQFTWSSGAWVAQGEKGRIYDGKNVVQERDGQGILVALYVRGKDMGGGIGGLLARVFDVGTSFMHYDGRGNVVQLTDASGAVSGKYSYDAFGRLLSITGGAAGLNPYRFSTKEAVGLLVYYGFRFYAPSLGKWINRDPIGEDGGNNLYGFAFNSPINLFDVDGRVLPLVAWLVVGGVVLAFGAMTYRNTDYDAVKLTRAQSLQVAAMINKLIACAAKQGDNELIRNLKSVVVVGRFKSFNPVEDATSETKFGLDMPPRLVLSNDFFRRGNICSQYRTLVHESYHSGTGIGKSADDDDSAYAWAAKKLSKIKGCLGCKAF